MLKYNGTKWKFKDSISMPSSDLSIAVTNLPYCFISNSKAYREISVAVSLGKIYFDSDTVYADGAWVSDAYRTIEFQNEPDRFPTAASSWFEENADRIIGHYIVSETDMRLVSDAIRAKTGSDVLLSFPDGFVSAIQSL